MRPRDKQRAEENEAKLWGALRWEGKREQIAEELPANTVELMRAQAEKRAGK